MDIDPHELKGIVFVAKSSITWTINDYTNFHNAKKFRERVVSPIFSTISGDTEHKWRMDLYPRGTDQTSENWLCIFLVNVSDVDVQASCNFIILGEKDRRVWKKYMDMRLFRKNHNEELFWGSGNFFKCDYMFDEKNRMLVGDKLKIYCEITEWAMQAAGRCYKKTRF